MHPTENLPWWQDMTKHRRNSVKAHAHCGMTKPMSDKKPDEMDASQGGSNLATSCLQSWENAMAGKCTTAGPMEYAHSIRQEHSRARLEVRC